jgi:predicted N-acyltransferase
VVKTIQDIQKAEWESLVDTDLTGISHAWFKTVEESGMRDMSYVLVKEDGNLVAAAVCYPYTEALYSVRVPFLEVRSPFGVSPAFFFKSPAFIEYLMRGLRQVQMYTDTQGLLLLELKKDEFTTIRKKAKHMVEFPLHDETYLDLDFNDFDEYLQSLGSSDRRSIRKTLNRAEKRWNITTVFTHEFSRWKHVAHNLLGYMCEEHDSHRMHLTGKFYDALEKNLKDRAELIICFKENIPLACGLVLNSATTAQHKFVGIDPEYRKYQAYFLLYYEGIKRAIEKNQEKICFGPTTYSFKEKIGCRREKVFGLVRINNPVLHLLLKSYIKIFTLKDKKF